MPLQNRVDPWGQLQAVTARGTLFGNRGILHNGKQEIVAHWKTKAWITCRLAWKGWKRAVMSPGTYTELFFLDEATAFSAGHRPCATCRRARFKEFKLAWIAANAELIASLIPPISEIDKVLHAERVLKGGKKVASEAELGTLPDGTMVEVDGVAYLLWGKLLLQWSFTGYVGAEELPPLRRRVQVLTPASIVQVFRGGFRPEVHESASRLAPDAGAP
jgi:hypothetical protein